MPEVVPATEVVLSNAEFSVSGRVAAHEVTGLRIAYSDRALGDELGTISFSPMSFRSACRIVGSLGERRSSVIPSVHSAEQHARLFRALWMAANQGCPFQSEFGNDPVAVHSGISVRAFERLDTEQLKACVAMREIVPGIVHLEFVNRALMHYSLLRFQESFDCYRLVNQQFTLAESVPWYAHLRESAVWSSYPIARRFCFPGWIAEPYRRGEFDPLHRGEKALLELFEQIKAPFYVIGTLVGTDVASMRHELAVGMFHTNYEYRRCVEEVLAPLNLKSFTRLFRRLDYAPHVFEEKSHALILADLERLESQYQIDITSFKAVSERLNQLLDEFCKAGNGRPLATGSYCSAVR